MALQLKRPIVVFDLETTGTSITTDRIVEISIIKIHPDGTEEERSRRLNPGCPIPAEATAVHHITDADVADCPTFAQIARSLAELLEGCDIAGFNSNHFDVPLLDQEFQRAGVKFDFRKASLIDVQTIYHKKEPRTLVAAYRYYCDKDLNEAHSALADARATYEVLKAQLEKYDDLPCDVEKLSEYTTLNRNVDLAGRLIYDEQGREVINFGKYKGRVAEDVLREQPGFYNWLMQAEFSQNTKDRFAVIHARIAAKQNSKSKAN